jgi:hypothetical protein
VRAHPAFIFIFVITIAALIAVHPAMAFTDQAIPFVNTCDSIFMQPMCTADATIIEFNSASTAAASLETLSIDFPVSERLNGDMLATLAAGPVAGASALPFGPVGLAFPSISQTSEETYSCQRTYFFVDFTEF